MANRRPQTSGRRMDFGRNDRNKNFRSGVSPWQGGGPGNDLPNLLPLGGGSTEATLALASNIINLLQPRQNPVPSLLDMPIRRDFGPNMGRYDRGFGPNRMGNQGNFRRTGNYNRAGERINTNRKPFRPNDGQKQQYKSSQKKEADSKAKPVKESEENQDDGEKSENKDEQKKETPKTRYDDINSQLLKCHICNKSMWDGRSFENHLSGRAHAIMMQKTAESYALTADTMRQEFKIREMKRTRKIGAPTPRDFYCAMCDMYAADGAIHRTTVGHRKLKKYLHPMCASCHKEMPTRIELDEHRLTAEHLRMMQDKQEVVTKPKPEVMVISTLNMEQTYLREDRRVRRPDRYENKEAEAEKDETEQKQDGEVEVKEEGEGGDKEAKPEKEEQKKGVPTDNENTILDYKEGDDVTNLTPDMVPAYSTERGVGPSFLAEFKCFQCQLCRKLLDTEETAQVHLRTWRHHQLFVRLLNEKSGKEQQQQQEQDQTEQTESNKRPHTNEESGNWKRRKTSSHDEEDEDNNQNEQEDKEIVKMEEDQLANGGVEVEPTVANNDELEDWEQSVDEILKDESENNEVKLEKEEEKEQEPEQKTEREDKIEETKEEVSQESPTKVAKTPRGRGRGRRRY